MHSHTTSVEGKQMSRVELDLASLPQGQTYEDRYQGYLDVFARIARLPGNVECVVKHAPWSWVPLLYHLNCRCTTPVRHFDTCRPVEGAWQAMAAAQIDRSLIECLTVFRPETVDALWKCDMQWKIPEGRVRSYPRAQEFKVTNNGSYHRPEVLEFMRALSAYQPPKKKVIIVPCAADKPYPAPLHRAIMEIMPDDYYIMNATGVLGLIPQDLWGVMPWYDSGIPNEWRCMETVASYFTDHPHEHILVYSDYYNRAIYTGIYMARRLDVADFVLPLKFYPDYLPLHKPEYLNQLRDYLDKPRHQVANKIDVAAK